MNCHILKDIISTYRNRSIESFQEVEGRFEIISSYIETKNGKSYQVYATDYYDLCGNYKSSKTKVEDISCIILNNQSKSIIAFSLLTLFPELKQIDIKFPDGTTKSIKDSKIYEKVYSLIKDSKNENIMYYFDIIDKDEIQSIIINSLTISEKLYNKLKSVLRKYLK